MQCSLAFSPKNICHGYNFTLKIVSENKTPDCGLKSYKPKMKGNLLYKLIKRNDHEKTRSHVRELWTAINVTAWVASSTPPILTVMDQDLTRGYNQSTEKDKAERENQTRSCCTRRRVLTFENVCEGYEVIESFPSSSESLFPPLSFLQSFFLQWLKVQPVLSISLHFF